MVILHGMVNLVGAHLSPDNLPPAQLGAPLTPERQAARCMSAKYRSDKISRCLSCTRRWAGDTCRFQGVRIFYRAPDGSVDFVSFTQNPMDTVKPVTFPTKWNIPFSEEHRKITQVMKFSLIYISMVLTGAADNGSAHFASST